MTEVVAIRELLDRFRNGDRQALNRLVSLVSRGEALEEVRVELSGIKHDARLIALTGNSGVGKSTLVGQLIEHIRSQGETVAVLACDPESVLTGGALLGDRVRMSAHAGDVGVWVRSLATTSGRQSVTAHLDLAAQLLAQYGFDHVILETVGAGQGDVAVDAIADVVVLLIQPEIGDELQWEKAGVLEVADVVVVHKGDLPGAAQTETQARELLNLPGCEETPVVRVSSKTKEGIAELWELLADLPSRQRVSSRDTRRLLRLVQEYIADQFAAWPEDMNSVAEDWAAGKLTDADAVQRILAHVVD